VLWPWGFSYSPAPNGAALQTLGRKFAYFNGYEPKQSVGLYATDGTTDDFAYGELGLAAYTFEVGTAFFQGCATFENVILPDNLPALIYAAKVSRTPYQTPAGPDTGNVLVSPAAVDPGAEVWLTATLDDTRYNNQNGAEPTQDVAAAEYYVDVPPWSTEDIAVARSMAATDGTFDESAEGAVAAVDTGACARGGISSLYVARTRRQLGRGQHRLSGRCLPCPGLSPRGFPQRLTARQTCILI